MLPVAFSLGLALLAYQEMEKNPDKWTLSPSFDSSKLLEKLSAW